MVNNIFFIYLLLTLPLCSFGQGDWESAVAAQVRGDLTHLRCTGFLVHPRYLVTAGHCLSAEKNLNPCRDLYWAFDIDSSGPFLKDKSDLFRCNKVIRKYDNRSFQNLNDFALVELDRPVVGVTPLKIADKVAPLTGSILLISPSENTRMTVRYGEILELENNRILHNAPSSEGSSGAPILDPVSGEVLAIHTGVLAHDTKISVSFRPQHLKLALKLRSYYREELSTSDQIHLKQAKEKLQSRSWPIDRYFYQLSLVKREVFLEELFIQAIRDQQNATALKLAKLAEEAEISPWRFRDDNGNGPLALTIASKNWELGIDFIDMGAKTHNLNRKGLDALELALKYRADGRFLAKLLKAKMQEWTSRNQYKEPAP